MVRVTFSQSGGIYNSYSTVARDLWQRKPPLSSGYALGLGGTKSRNGEIRNEKLEMRKWKRKWKWSSLLLVDNTEVDAIVSDSLSMVYQKVGCKGFVC